MTAPILPPAEVVIARTPDDACELCGKRAELRPYGPQGEMVCFPCGMKNESAAKAAFRKRLAGTLDSRRSKEN